MFFDFLLNHTLHGVENVLVKTQAGIWPLDDTIVFCLEGDKRMQVLVDINSQQLQPTDKNDIEIRGNYEDLLSYELVRHGGAERQSSMVRSVTEFVAPNGKVIACEIELLSDANFALVLYPEDCEIRESGAAWDYCRKFGVPEIGSVTVTFRASAFHESPPE